MTLPPSALVRSLVLSSILAASTDLAAQRLKPERVAAAGVQLRVSDDLRLAPIQLEDNDPQKPYTRGRFESADNKAYRGTNFPKDGTVRVLAFGDGTKAEGRRRLAGSFEDFVRNHQVFRGERSFHVEGDKQRGRGKTPDYELWEYSEALTFGDGNHPMTQYHVAAVYPMHGHEVAIVYDFFTFGDDKPDRDSIRLGRQMVGSAVPIEVEDGGLSLDGDPRARDADTPERLARLEAVATPLVNIEGWDFTTTEQFIVVYSFEEGASRSKQKRAERDALELAEEVGAVRAQFEEDWPVDGGDGTAAAALEYPVLRVCNSREAYKPFNEGQEVGCYKPVSKEVVVFNDKAGEVATKDAVRQTAVHGAWLQFAEQRWPGINLQPWWRLGTGDYYAQFEPRGRRMRVEPLTNPLLQVEGERANTFRLESPVTIVQTDLRRDQCSPLRDFIQWDESKFEGARPVRHRAQAYTLVDFLARGPDELGRRFDESWAGIWRGYPERMAETKSIDKTIDALFGDVDWQRFEDAWRGWVDDHM